MPESVLILNANRQECEELISLLENHRFQMVSAHSLEDLESMLGKADYQALILDLDSVKFDNRLIRRICAKVPGTPLLCTSADRFHPQLEEAMANNIYACISKPVDPEEILYLLKCALENDAPPSKSNQSGTVDLKR